ncbi:MAG: hypothetical protein WAN46_22480 [Gammaproteobacteria bacterium]
MLIRARMMALLAGAALILSALRPLAAESVTAEQGVAAGRDIRDSTITIGYTAEQVQALIRASTHDLETRYQAQVDELSGQLEVTEDAVVAFFQILKEGEVPLDELPERLSEIAERHRELLDRLAVLEPEDATTRARIEAARQAIEKLHYDRADQLLREAETAELAAARKAEKLARQAQEVAERRQLKAAAIIAERGELSMTRLRYREASRHFESASEQVPSSNIDVRNDYLSRYAYALYRQGTERVDNTALSRAIQAYQEILKGYPRNEFPEQWATTQNNLGNALGNQGIRTGGEEGRRLLAEAVSAYRGALEVYTRAQLPQDWAQTQNNLAAVYYLLEDWANAAESYTNVLHVYADDREAYETAQFLYHEKLLAFEKSFLLTQRWFERHPQDVLLKLILQKRISPQVGSRKPSRG